VILISQNGRRVLGERIFSFEGASSSDAEQAVSEVIEQFYRFHIPKEIRLPETFSDKENLLRILYERIGRKPRIVALTASNRRVSTERAVYRASAELDIKSSDAQLSPAKLLRLLRSQFKLSQTPERVTAVDVAHISGTDQVAAAVSWASGRMDPFGSRHWVSDSASELDSLKRFVEILVSERTQNEAELFVIDGGLAQLNAAMAAKGIESISLVSAVKPREDHASIAYFLTEHKQHVEFDRANAAHAFLQRLRDEAHDLANAVHRDTRDYSNYYRMAEMLPSLKETERRKLLSAFGSIDRVSRARELELNSILAEDRVELAAADLSHWRLGVSRPVRPLVVPTRLQDETGAAEDLRPIENSVATS
jgi:excinuclease ABC subunit C